MIDTFTVRRSSGPCDDTPFHPGHNNWAGRAPIVMALGERIEVTLYGNGADFARRADCPDLIEWISARGTTTDYPRVRIMFGMKVPKGFATVTIRAESDQEPGEYTVRVKWLTGSENLRIKVVSRCAEVTPSNYRSGIRTGTPVLPGGRIVTGAVPVTPNLLPHLNTPYVLTRPVGHEILTSRGRMIRVADYFGAELQDNIVSAVRVPDLVWGVSGVNSDRIITMFDVQLIDVTDPNNPRILDTLTLPRGFPPNTPLVTRSNYPGRPREIRVIKNPTFQTGTQQLLDDKAAPDFTTYDGTFTEPGSRQMLDPGALLILVDPANRINEGNNENDNELRF